MILIRVNMLSQMVIFIP